MEFKIDADESDRPRRKTQAPPNYMSAGVRLRLMSLMAMLILVLIAMKVASKPETWERLGFRSEKVVQDSAASTLLLPESKVDTVTIPGNVDPVPEQQADPAQDGPPSIELKGRFSVDDIENNESFYRQMFSELDLNQRKDLFRLLRYGRIGIPLPPEYRSTAETLVAYIERQRSAYHQVIADQLSTIQQPDRRQPFESMLADDKTKSAAALKALATASIGQTLEPQQTIDLEPIQAVFDDMAFQQVKDQTSMTRTAEGPAWIRSWETILDGRFLQTAKPVKQIQLISQPDAYRGKGVSVRGELRGAEKITVPENELGIQQYYVLWVRPETSNLAPYCIYTLFLPEGFPSVGNQFVTFDETIEVSGIFFKIRSYLTKGGEMENCPLILAKSFHWIRTQNVAKKNSVPTALFMWPFLVLIPIVAGLCAYLVYRTTQVKRYVGDDAAVQTITTDLAKLNDDQSIKTDTERIQMLYQRDSNSSEATDG